MLSPFDAAFKEKRRLDRVGSCVTPVDELQVRLQFLQYILFARHQVKDAEGTAFLLGAFAFASFMMHVFPSLPTIEAKEKEDGKRTPRVHVTRDLVAQLLVDLNYAIVRRSKDQMAKEKEDTFFDLFEEIDIPGGIQ